MVEATAPAIAGPAGATFEGQVGAFYLLSLLANTEARGLPGAKMGRVGLQKAPEGLELDDVVVYGVHDDGTSATLEIQVKRSIRFTSGDPVWTKVVGQIVAAASKPSFWSGRHELAVAIAKTTAKIDGSYQEVLMWARNLGLASAFFTRLRMKGVASDAMRDFVQSLRDNLGKHGHPADDETVWNLLKRFQILIFDFTTHGSVCKELCVERGARLLDPVRGGNGDQLWNSLIVSSLLIASNGGDRDRNQLHSELRDSFSFQGTRESLKFLDKLSEAALLGLSDIDQTISSASLARSQYVARLREQLDEGRYVEIRGESGTGKSAILRQLADQVRIESRILYLSPHRTVPGGWLAFQAILQTDLGLSEFLSEIAANGGVTIFVDNLDFFSEAAQVTVKDIVRHAALVRGVNVVVTCRKSFGTDVPSWLPSSAIEGLGGSRVVDVSELTEEEFAELSITEPNLAPLLRANSPARPVVANLFRLSRLARTVGSEAPTTEASMATQWWASSDNLPQDLRRDGKRLLRAAAEHFLFSNHPFDTRQFNASVIDALVKQGTLQDLRMDEVGFKHDVLRDWAIANLLFERPEMVASLHLASPLRSSIVRAVDLLARLTIEGASSSSNYFVLLDCLSGPSSHGSWRRPVLLALVRSEVSDSLLDRCRAQLLSNGAILLSELVRTLMAVEVQSAPKFLESLGVDVSRLVEDVKLPIGPAWRRLIGWLLKQSDSELAHALQDVVDLFSTWSFATLGVGVESQKVTARLHAWLVAIEKSRYATLSAKHFRRTPPFSGAAQRENLIRRCFLQFAGPQAAKQYLKHVQKFRRNDDIAREILRHSGSLSKNAPEELASLTVASLIPQKDDGSDDEDEIEGIYLDPLTFLDSAFIPAGPGQGPFLLLLINSPANGLSAIRQIIKHIVTVRTGGRDANLNSISLRLNGTNRRFEWEETYLWSHGNYDCFSAASALMALEAWGHRRIEQGENVTDVLNDVLGTGNQPMCYLAVAVDLILSHWEVSAKGATTFLANPDLLVLDRERQVFDNFGGGRSVVNSDSNEGQVPRGYDTAEMLSKRPSRGWTLLQRLYGYAFSGDSEHCRQIIDLLLAAREKLGPYSKDANFRDPAFMAAHAISALDKSNWKVETTKEGSLFTFIGAESERPHLEALASQAQSLAQKTNLDAALALAVEDPSRSSEALARAGVDWAKAQGEPPQDETEAWARSLMMTRAALIAMRDGDPILRQTEGRWAVSILRNAYEQDSKDRFPRDSQLQYSHTGMAFLGIALAMKVQRWEGDVDLLLTVSQSHNTGAAVAFRHSIDALAELDPRLPKSILRVALAAQVRTRHDWMDEEAARADMVAEEEARRRHGVAAELDWLANQAPEPRWPTFPDPVVRRNNRIIRLPRSENSEPVSYDEQPGRSGRYNEYVDIYGAYSWFKSFADRSVFDSNSWIIDLVRHFRSWTLKLNGVGLKKNLEVASDSNEWNRPYFSLVFKASSAFVDGEIASWLDPILQETQDDDLCSALRDIIFELDLLYFSDCKSLNVDSVAIRSAAAERICQTNLWRWRVRERTLDIDMELGGIVATLFFSNYLMGARSICYLTPVGMDRVGPFIPVLQQLVSEGAFGFVAVATLSFLETKPDHKHLSFTAACLRFWLDHFGANREFWVDVGIGSRICNLITNMRRGADSSDLDVEIATLLPNLVKLGITEAKDLEELLVGN